MGQKTHPYAFRIGIVNDWKSRWFNSKDYKDFKEDGSDGDQCISINNYMKVWEVLDLKEEAGGMGAGSFATVAMPLFTGKKGKAHHKAARAAVGLKDSKKTKDPVYSNMIRRNP